MGGKLQSGTEGRRYFICTIPPNIHCQGRWGKNHLNRKSHSCLGLGRLGFHAMELSQKVWIRDKLYSRDKPVDEPLIYCVIIQRHVCPPGYVAHLPTGVTRREASTTSPAGKKSPILLIASDGECVCVVFKEGSIPGGHDGFRQQPNTERTSLRQLLQRLSAAAAQPLREFRYRYC
jgi:hypothetical protein